MGIEVSFSLGFSQFNLEVGDNIIIHTNHGVDDDTYHGEFLGVIKNALFIRLGETDLEIGIPTSSIFNIMKI